MNAIINANFNGLNVSFRNDAYLNATAIAKQYNKQPRDYLKTEQTQEYLTALAQNLSVKTKILTDENQLVVVKKGGKEQGTWLHPKLAIHFARWLDAKFAVWCDEQIENILHKLTGDHIDKYTTADERTGLRQAADALVGKYGLLYPDAYRLVHQRFNVTSIDELTIEQVAQATEYLHKLLLSGKGMTLPAIEFPTRFIDKTNAKNGNGRMGIKELNQMYESRDIPLNILMFNLEKQGYDTSACRDEYNLLRNLVRSAFDKLEFMASCLSDGCYSKARLPSAGGQLSLM